MIKKALTYLFATPLLLAASCISENIAEYPANNGGKKDVTLNLKLRMGLDDNASRADKGDQDGYEDPNGAFEEISTLRVIILNTTEDGTTEVEGARLVATNSAGVPLNDNLEFKVKSNAKTPKEILLIANEASLPSPVDGITVSDFLNRFKDSTPNVTVSNEELQQLRDWTVSMPGTEPNSTESLFTNYGTRLPLTESFKVFVNPTVSASASEETYIQETTLFLTRAAAKATFAFEFDNSAPQSFGTEVTGIRINGINWSEYVFPRDVVYNNPKYIGNVEGYVNNTTAKRYITSFAAPPQPTDQGASYTFDISNNPVEIRNNYYTTAPERGPIYFPESLLASGNPFTVEVEIDGNGHWLPAQPLETNILSINGKDAIARNTHLKINISFSKSNILCTVSVVPYIGVILDPIFGFEEANPSNKN